MRSIENFSLGKLDFLADPIGTIKKLIMGFVIFMVKVVIAGIIFYIAMKMAGLTEDKSMMNYVKYFFIGGAILYALTFIYFMYNCRGVSMGKMNYKKFFLSSLFVPTILLVHIIILFLSPYIQAIPEIGTIIYILLWTSFGIVLTTGIMYMISFEVASRVTSCSV